MLRADLILTMEVNWARMLKILKFYHKEGSLIKRDWTFKRKLIWQCLTILLTGVDLMNKVGYLTKRESFLKY